VDAWSVISLTLLGWEEEENTASLVSLARLRSRDAYDVGFVRLMAAGPLPMVPVIIGLFLGRIGDEDEGEDLP
jgi:hypothetical protein